jgi:ER membrane protein complex subunit 1
MRFSSSDMESTIFIFAYGIDNFLIRTSPDRTFDMITEDFNYLILIAIMTVVTIGVLYLRHISKKARMIKPHRD